MAKQPALRSARHPASRLGPLTGLTAPDTCRWSAPRRRRRGRTYSYVPVIAAGLVALGTDERAVGQTWHLPGPETVTTRDLLEMLAAEVGHPIKMRTMPTVVLRALGMVSPMMRELAEMSYEFEETFVVDTSKFESTSRPRRPRSPPPSATPSPGTRPVGAAGRPDSQARSPAPVPASTRQSRRSCGEY